MSVDLHPKTDRDVLAAVQWAVAEEQPVEIVGQGSKRALGRPSQVAHVLDMSGLSGVTLFEPEELVLSAKAGTPLSQLTDLLEQNNQEFQFEPVDLGPLLGQEEGQGTLGGMVSTNLAGSKRLKFGSARDHILGVKAVSGRGEIFKSGGRVVKNVTGYDLSKGVTGSFGTLAALTDITMKVMPKSETEQTLLLLGLSDAEAAEAMALAMGSSAEVSGAAHLPAGIDGDRSKTLLRLDGFAPSVDYRISKLGQLLSAFGNHEQLGADDSRRLWKSVSNCHFFAGDETPVWRLSCTPSEGYKLVSDLRSEHDMLAYYDWQGGLIWLKCGDGELNEEEVRTKLSEFGGGHATLIRATANQRQTANIFQPQPAPLAALSQRYRENFDPKRILNPGRMG